MASVEDTLPPPTKSNFIRSLTGILIRPRLTFEDLRNAGGRGWILLAGLALLFSILKIGVEAPISARVAEESIRASLDAQAEAGMELPENAVQQATQMATNPLFTVAFPSVLAVFGLIISWLAWSGALHLLGTILGGSNSFRQMLSMVVWSWLPYILRSLVQIISIVTTGKISEHPGLSFLVATDRSIGEIIAAPPPTSQILLQSFLGQVDLFLIWNLVLLVLGVMITARISGKKAFLITSLVWILFTAVTQIPVLFSATLMQSGFGM
jgi:hypothetical protein